MSFVRRYLPDDLPFIPKYAHALRWHEQVKPFAKGKNVGEKPLGNNRRYARFKLTRPRTSRLSSRTTTPASSPTTLTTASS